VATPYFYALTLKRFNSTNDLLEVLRRYLIGAKKKNKDIRERNKDNNNERDKSRGKQRGVGIQFWDNKSFDTVSCQRGTSRIWRATNSH
jgi:hypothetical protein